MIEPLPNTLSDRFSRENDVRVLQVKVQEIINYLNNHEATKEIKNKGGRPKKIID